MGSVSSDSEPAVFMINPDFGPDEHLESVDYDLRKYERKSFTNKDPWLKKKRNQVFLEGYVKSGDEDDQEQGLKGVTRTKSLTDDDLDELKGCLDLGFGFSYDEIPELCNTLPALELCYSMSQKFLDEQQKSPEASATSSTANELCSSTSSPIANWKISSPGDHPEDVKARLKYWAQAVACTNPVLIDEAVNDDARATETANKTWRKEIEAYREHRGRKRLRRKTRKGK